jgi:F-box protein 11
MNDLPRQKLSEIVARHGRDIASDPRRVEGLLRDYGGPHRREIAVLVSAAEEGVAADLLAVGAGLPREALFARLARRLHDNVAMEAAAARWAVNSWALALGVISDAELEAMEPGEPETASAADVTQIAPQPAPRSSPSEIIVSAAGDGDFTSLTEALNAAPPGARLLVRAGLYREGVVLDKLVEIIAEGGSGRDRTGQEVIIASAEASCIRMQTSEATVRGLTLRQEPASEGDGFFAVDIPQGRLTLEDCDVSSGSLSCVGIHNDSADPVIRRCRIHGSADSGVYVFNAAAGTIEDCDIYDNTNVGLAITERANPTARRCRVREGKNAGIVSWNGGLGVIEECEIFGNGKAGVGVSEEAELSLRRCRIYGGNNSGVFVHHGGQALAEDCDIYGNAEPEVAVSHDGKFVARGCSIREGRSSGVVVDVDGVAVLEQCDLQGNAGAGVTVNAEGVAALSQCRITHNGTVAVSVQSGGEVIVENCDLTGNRNGAWQAARGAAIKESGNRS